VFSDPIYVQSPKKFLGACGKNVNGTSFFFSLEVLHLWDQFVNMTNSFFFCSSLLLDNNDLANHLNKYSIRIPSRKDEKPPKE
jgi:hypothetical protein